MNKITIIKTESSIFPALARLSISELANANPMELIYKASNISEAHIVAGLLKTYEIDAHVGGHYLQGGVGDLAVMDFATIHVPDEDVAAARAIIDEYEQKNKHVHPEDQGKNSYVTTLVVIAVSVLAILVLSILMTR